MQAIKLKEVKAGEYIKLAADGKTVYVRGDYERTERKYSVTKFDDHCAERFIKGDKVVFIGFDF